MSGAAPLRDQRRMMRLVELVNGLRALPSETEWAEFKQNQFDPDVIGKTVSALSNGARLKDQENAYLVWGVEDGTHAIVGTNIDTGSLIKGQPFKCGCLSISIPVPS